MKPELSFTVDFTELYDFVLGLEEHIHELTPKEREWVFQAKKDIPAAVSKLKYRTDLAKKELGYYVDLVQAEHMFSFTAHKNKEPKNEAE